MEVMMTFPSDPRKSGIITGISGPGEDGLQLTLEECQALLKFLEHESIGEKEFPGAREVVKKMSNFVKSQDNELAR
jgi:hypothetical protein